MQIKLRNTRKYKVSLKTMDTKKYISVSWISIFEIRGKCRAPGRITMLTLVRPGTCFPGNILRILEMFQIAPGSQVT
jgi:hypothetical protein